MSAYSEKAQFDQTVIVFAIPGFSGSYVQTYNFVFQLTRQSIHIQKGKKGEIELTLTVPFPCVYQRDAVHLNEIADYACPLNIELTIPEDEPRVCKSRLVGEGKCGIALNAKKWNEPYVMKITHQPTGKYKLTIAEAEKTLYLKTLEYDLSNAWSKLLLPVVKVMFSLLLSFLIFFCYIFYLFSFNIFCYRFTLMILKVDGKEQVAQHIVIPT